MNREKYFKIISLAVLLFILYIPIGLYFNIFNNGFSHNNQDWGAFGSFISGVYSPLLAFISVLILIETLKEMQRTNKREMEQFDIQMEQSRSEKKLNDIITLTNMLNNIIDNNPSINDRISLPKQFAGFLHRKCQLNMVTEEHELWEQAFDVMREEQERFTSEMYVLAEIVRRVNSIEDEELQETAKAIVKGLIPNSYRFWLECYANVWSFEARTELKKWPFFSDIPIEASHILPEGPDMPEEH